MEKGFYLSLQDVGDLIYRVTQRYLFRNLNDYGIEVTMRSVPMQENLVLHLPDGSNLLVKTFPHKNVMRDLIYRIEVYKTRIGELRGVKIAFLEVTRADTAVSEIQKFVQGYLAQLGF